MGVIDLELPQRWHPWLRQEICVLSGGKREIPEGGERESYLVIF